MTEIAPLSGLRDAIAVTVREYFTDDVVPGVVDDFERTVVRWLSHIGEGEREAAAEVLHKYECGCQSGPDPQMLEVAGEIIAASRGVLLPKEKL